MQALRSLVQRSAGVYTRPLACIAWPTPHYSYRSTVRAFCSNKQSDAAAASDDDSDGDQSSVVDRPGAHAPLPQCKMQAHIHT